MAEDLSRARLVIARSRDQFSGVTAYNRREGSTVGQYKRCENGAELPHIVVPCEIRRYSENLVSRLVDNVDVECTSAVGIHCIGSREGFSGDVAIQA